ncbi:DUF3888 domain-containing protein [Bacillus sp. FJAT-27225]|uniref:DUF3888 domain-containing protein n=1 Tax=Bacillus sp. FJAT-27225 TaxID=1743144 RepID=UPI000980A43B|nr:DUF3888 domain-containing protein [Bacillus sp. FJAT-27225]
MKTLGLQLFIISFFALGSFEVHAQPKNKPVLSEQVDSHELRVQDMLMNFLNPHIDDAVCNYYKQILTECPMVYPYFVDVVKSQRMNGFRGFILQITLDVTPTIGPHISVGKDRITFEVSAGPTVRMINYKHLETHELPEHWKDIIRGPL